MKNRLKNFTLHIVLNVVQVHMSKQLYKMIYVQ